tara:strand:+ start:1141 stop:1560 length:420 start_codon:yes stop_codon:yes gene_type:complete
MNNMHRYSLNFDTIGIIAGTLCAIHCIATPLLFIAKACSSACCTDAPTWWIMIDYLFLLISFTVIFFISKNLEVKWVKNSFWLSWGLLSFSILDHSFGTTYLPENFIYIPSFFIILLHLYNIKFCKCEDVTCCCKTDSY